MKQLLSWLQQQLPEGLALLERLVDLDSPSTEKALVDRCSRFAGERFEAIGGAVDFIAESRFGDHLRVRFPGSPQGGRILLLGHVDTVFPAGEAAKRPFHVGGGRATGPGVFDMKGGILLMWLALQGAMRLGRLRNAVTVLLTSDEEVSSPSSRGLVEAEARQADAVLVLEPPLPNGVLKTARKGVGRFSVTAFGRAAHAGVDPSKGINAIEEIAHQVLRLQAMSGMAPGATVTVGVIRGGTRSNVAPAEASIDVDVRAAASKDVEQLTQAIRSLRPVLPGARIDVAGGFTRPPMERNAATVKLFRKAQAIGAGLGMDIAEGATGGASDGNLTSALGIPTLDGLGPVGDGAHAIDEYIEVASLPQRAALLAGMLATDFGE